MTKRIAFAVPGDLKRLTGGTLYDRRVIHELEALGLDVTHIQLLDSFPDPSPEDMRDAFAQLAAIPPETPLIVDGLAFGALNPEGVGKLPTPLVPFVHHPLAEESGLPEGRRKRLFETEQRNLGQARHVLVPSPHTANILMSGYGVGKSDITIARPGTDQPKTKSSPADPPLILAVGIQVVRKGHDVLIKALAQIQDLDWQAVIVGARVDAAFAEQLEKTTQDLGLTERLVLAGQVDREQLQKLYDQASLFALATRYEGYGIVFNEALAHGLPIVSCATGAVSDTVPNDTGLLTPPDNPVAFAHALRTMLTDRAVRQSAQQAAKAAGRELPGWSDTAKTILKAVEDLPIESAR